MAYFSTPRKHTCDSIDGTLYILDFLQRFGSVSPIIIIVAFSPPLAAGSMMGCMRTLGGTNEGVYARTGLSWNRVYVMGVSVRPCLAVSRGRVSQRR